MDLLINNSAMRLLVLLLQKIQVKQLILALKVARSEALTNAHTALFGVRY